MQRSRILTPVAREQGGGGPDGLFEMANLFSKHTGLPFVVWISYKGGALHDVRVRIAETASVAIRPEIRVVQGTMSARDLALLSKWIEINRDVLVKYWEGEIDTKDAIEAIQAV